MAITDDRTGGGDDWTIDYTDALTEATVTEARFEKATADEMTVEEFGPGIADVHSSSGNTYRVELVSGACDCPDAMHRGPGCKHAVRAALAFGLFDFDRFPVIRATMVAAFGDDHRAVLGVGDDLDGLTGMIEFSTGFGEFGGRLIMPFEEFGAALDAGAVRVVEMADAADALAA